MEDRMTEPIHSEFLDSNEILLITATIDAEKTPYVAINNTQERLFEYLCSLIAWIKLTSIKTIVFCENSNTDYDFGNVIELARSQEKNLEILIFNERSSQKYGKGYGEGKILEFAMTNSKYLNKNSINFYKITGRGFIKNFEEIRKLHIDKPNIFNAPGFNLKSYYDSSSFNKLGYRFIFEVKFALKTQRFHDPRHTVATRFYKSNVNFFKENLLNSYKKVYDKWGYYLEHTYYDSLRGKSFSSFLIEPQIVGRCGTSAVLLNGGDYTDEIKSLAKVYLSMNKTV